MDIYFYYVVALAEQQWGQVLQALFQLLSSEDVILTLNLPYLLGEIGRVVFRVIYLLDYGLIPGPQLHPNLMAVGGTDVYCNVVQVFLEAAGPMS